MEERWDVMRDARFSEYRSQCRRPKRIGVLDSGTMTKSSFSFERGLAIVDNLLILSLAVAIIRSAWETPSSFRLLVGADGLADSFRTFNLLFFIGLTRIAGRDV